MSETRDPVLEIRDLETYEVPNLLARIAEYVQQEMSTNDSSHDYFHIQRVRNLTLSLSQSENLTPKQTYVAEISALFHDLKDWKYRKSPIETGLWGAPIEIETFLHQQHLNPDLINQVAYVVSHVGFSHELEGPAVLVDPQLTQILAVVQDADRLDALGAIGIARCLTYGGAKNRILFDPDQPPRMNLSASEYKSGKSTTMNHFHEKLFKLKDLMKTDTGRQLAQHRTQIMESFVHEFEQEWFEHNPYNRSHIYRQYYHVFKDQAEFENEFQKYK